MNKVFKRIKEWWYLYLVALILLPIGVSYLTYMINLPRNEETISIFIASCGSDVKKLREALEKEKPQYLRQISIKSYVYSDHDFSTYYNYFGCQDVDIVVLPESKISSDVVLSNYKKLETDLDSGATYYYPEGASSPYGKRIHKQGEENGLITYKDETHDEDYYLFYGKDSLHLGAMSDTKWDTALTFAKIIEGEQ